MKEHDFALVNYNRTGRVIQSQTVVVEHADWAKRNPLKRVTKEGSSLRGVHVIKPFQSQRTVKNRDRSFIISKDRDDGLLVLLEHNI
jgi:hypothetical protein